MGSVSRSPDNFSGPKSCFMFSVFAFKIKVSGILKMVKWKHLLSKQNWQVCELKNVLLLITYRFWLQNLPSDAKSHQALRNGPLITNCPLSYWANRVLIVLRKIAIGEKDQLSLDAVGKAYSLPNLWKNITVGRAIGKTMQWGIVISIMCHIDVCF